MRCIYCGVAEQNNDHGCTGCGAPKSQSPEGLIWPYRLPRDQAEKAQLDAEMLRNQVRLQVRETAEKESSEQDKGVGSLAIWLLVLLFLMPALVQVGAVMAIAPRF